MTLLVFVFPYLHLFESFLIIPFLIIYFIIFPYCTFVYHTFSYLSLSYVSLSYICLSFLIIHCVIIYFLIFSYLTHPYLVFVALHCTAHHLFEMITICIRCEIFEESWTADWLFLRYCSVVRRDTDLEVEPLRNCSNFGMSTWNMMEHLEQRLCFYSVMIFVDRNCDWETCRSQQSRGVLVTV